MISSLLLRTTLALGLLLALSTKAGAREVNFSLRFDEELIRQYLLTEVYTDGEGTARVWGDSMNCNFLTLADPKVDVRSGVIQVMSAATARVGTTVGERCLVLLDWAGFVEVFEEPVLGVQPGVVEFRVVDSNVYAPDGARAGATGTLWAWLKSYVHPRLERLRLDVNPALADIKGMVPVVFPADEALVQGILDSVSLSQGEAHAGHVELGLRLNVPEQLIAEPAPMDAEPALSGDELKRWTQAAHEWDAFITLVIKHAGLTAESPARRAELLGVLLEARRDVLAILTLPPADGADPLRVLLADTWSRLAPVLRAKSRTLPPESALRWLGFIAATDALRAIDELGAELGFTVSADALRHLARIAVPEAPADALDYSDAVDPALRLALGFGAPLPPPRSKPRSGLDMSFFFEEARATEMSYDVLVDELTGWIPTLDTLQEYLPLVGDLLIQVTQVVRDVEALAPEYRETFKPLVLATAWQESCWRQFVERQGKYVPLSSGSGSVGLMQINQNVWRGFYDVRGLGWDVGYNARAGAEILRHYLVDYAIAQGEHTITGAIDNLARATYAMYNGGPSQLTRYRAADTADAMRTIDAAFWEKYQAMKRTPNNSLQVASCYQDE